MKQPRVVFITGAASGIGFDIANAFAMIGDLVVICDVNKEALHQAVQILQERGLEVTGMECDVTKEKDLQQALQSTMQQKGGIDVLINNAGFQHVSMLEDFPTETFEKMIKVMLTAPFIAMKAVIPHMKGKRSGRIINIASINGLVGFSGKAAYNSAKHGVIGLTKVAALELASYGITVNALCPGYVDTPLVRNQLADLAKTRNISVEEVLEQVIFPLVPQKRLLETQEIADYLLFLASEKAKGITGQSVVIDGGYTAQ